MKEDNINELEIHWFITFDDNIRHSPIFVESNLLQAYFDEYGVIPLWNMKF